MTKHYITPEEHARLQRRRGRQALGLLITILVLVGFVTVLRAGVGLVANLFDDTAQKQEYEDKLEGLVLFDPMPFDREHRRPDPAGSCRVGLHLQHPGDAGRLR